jgi:hypothetical protein
MFLMNLLIIIFLFSTLLKISLAEKKIIYLLNFTSIQHAETTLFFKACLFFPWLAGRSENFELTQNGEKTRNGLGKNSIHRQIHYNATIL